jgi:3D (Asp-Asp-Asp) domain-containing protein
MARLDWRAAAATVALLAVTIIGGGPNGKEEAQLGQGIQPQTPGRSTAQSSGTLWTKAGATDGEGTIFTGRTSGSIPGSGRTFMEAEGRKVQERLGIGKADKQSAQPGLGSDSSAPGEGTEAGSTSGPNGGGSPRRFDSVSRLGDFTITAYTAGYESTQKKPGQEGYGITYSGTTVKEGRTIAADLNILPVGTRVYIEDVGERTVEDKGGAVNGKHIDLYIADLGEAQDWGKQTKEVYVIEWGKKSND